MTKKPRPGPVVPDIGRPAPGFRLGWRLLCAEFLVIQLNEAEGGRIRPPKAAAVALATEIGGQDLGPMTRWMSAMFLYFTMIDVIVEAWKQEKFEDPEVDALLADEVNLARVHQFRNEFLHGGSPLSGKVVDLILNWQEVEEWSNRLRIACNRFVREHFAAPTDQR